MQPLLKPIPVYNIDRMPNKAGAIGSVVDLVLHYQNHMEEALYKDNQSNGRALEEEHGGEFGGICKPELSDEAIEVED
ncbi:hypothetical protein C0989_007163 [Termitomyces sp. Mn162]|nr:hypothetical protein C0989_007163 [Termitomyces sp. Mn162]